jgi:CRISPR system Cascade subunit CasB
MTTKTKAKPDRFRDTFIRRLEELVEKEDRGALATLRRGLGKEVPFETYRFMPLKRTRWQEDAALLIGPLFALCHQGTGEVRNAGETENLGASMLALVNAMGREATKRDDAMKRVERRFTALLNCHRDDLRVHLRHAVSLLRSEDVPINWRLLLRDVQHWSHEDRWVQGEWARSFWAPRTEGDELPEEEAPRGTSDETDADSGGE